MELKRHSFHGLSNLFALSGLGYVFLLPPLLNNSSNLNKISKIALCISSFFLVLGIICIQLVFSLYMYANENMTLYLLTMVVHHGNLIHGINILFMIIWILSILSYISTTFFFILYIAKKMLKIENVNPFNYAFALLFLGTSVAFQNYPQVFSSIKSIMQNSILLFVFLLEPLLLLTANIKKSIQERKYHEKNN